MIQPKKYKAKDLKGDWVEGWFAEIHIALTDNHDNLIGYKSVPSLFNDEPGQRSNGGYWHEIQPLTLQEVNYPQQLSLF